MVYDQRPSNSELLIPALEVREAKLGCIPRLIAADGGFYSAKNEAAAKAKGVKRVCIPKYNRKNTARRSEQKKHGSATGSDGARDAKDASALAGGDTASIDVVIAATNGMKRWVDLG